VRNITHGTSAAAAMALLGTYALHQPPGALLLSAAVAAGAGTLPDLDTVGSAPARAFGLLTEALAWCVRAVSGGHREGTHTALGDVTFASIAVLALWAERFPVTLHAARDHWHTSWGMLALIAYLALLFGAGSKALRVMHRHDLRREALAITAATVLALSGYDAHGIALAVLVGTVAHCAGDGITKHGVAWFLPFSRRVIHLLPKRLRITTGGRAERWLVMPALVLVLAFLAYRAVTVPGAVPLHVARG
jgi:membrane-bound metal-dependent hydrolase YbcI (DUF457 family)